MDLIIARNPVLSPQLQEISRFVLDHPNDLALYSARAVAKRAAVTPSSLVRFAQELGYEGFSELQDVVRSRVMLQFNSYQERLATLGNLSAENGTDEGSIIDDVIRDGATSLGRLREMIATENLHEALTLLAGAEHIFVLAQGKPFPVAFYLAFAFLRLKRRCQLLDGSGGVIRQQLELTSARDALVVVSFRPYTPLVVECAADCRGRGVPVIAITDSLLSPLAAPATVAFEIKEQGNQVYQSLVAPMCFAQILVLGLGHHLSEQERGAERRRNTGAVATGNGGG